MNNSSNDQPPSQETAVSEHPAELHPKPTKKLAVLTCMDARVNPYEILDLELGEAHIIRNAGAVLSPEALRSLALSQQLLDTDTIIVMAHTDCGVLGANDDELTERFKRLADGQAPPFEIHGFEDTEVAVKNNVESLRSSPFIKSDATISGYVYDVHAATLSQIC